MKAVRLIAQGMLLLGFLLATAQAQTFIWTGVGTGWQGQVTPPNDGTADFFLSDTINENVVLAGDFSLNTILLSSNHNYSISPAGSATLPLTLTLASGALISGTSFGRLQFDPNINLSLGASAVFDAGNGVIVVPGHITGASTTVILMSSGPNGFFTFNNSGAGNTYTGSTQLLSPVTDFVGVSFWNNSPFGTGAVTVFNSSQLVAHNTLTVANPLVFDTTVASDPIFFKSWDAPLTFSGSVSLANNTTLTAQLAQSGVSSADSSGTFLVPGPRSRNPTVFTGNITESGGARTLTVNGQGVIILNPAAGSNAYTGGTTVNGSLVLGSLNAIPAGASNVLVNNSGYVGIANTTPGTFAALLGHVNGASLGTVGVDTLPGNATSVLTDPINLTGFTSTAIRIGTATSAILQGTITPQGATYQFGNGGGTLFVQSSLNLVGGGGLVLNNSLAAWPLKLYLQGTNTYTGGSVAQNGFLFFDGLLSIPATGQLTAGGSPATPGNSYVGYTDAVTLMTPASFLALFNKSNTYGIIGFDTHAGNSTVAISSPIDLTGFNNGVYLGTATGATLSGTLTPTADHTLRLTAALGSTLTVNSTLADLNGGTTPLAVSLGSSSVTDVYSSGTVALNGANTYTGGTTINTTIGGLTLQVGGASPLGTGALSLAPNVIGGLQAATSNYTLTNNIVFQAPAVGQLPASLYLSGAQSLNLAGAISGPAGGDISIAYTQAVNSPTFTLSGNNQNYAGDIDVLYGTLDLAHNNAAGTGTLSFDGPATVAFTGAATNPILYGIKGDTGAGLVLPDGTTLTFDMSNPVNGNKFGGVISGSGGMAGPPSTASVVVTSTTSHALFLYGSGNYSGGTTITNSGIVGVGSNNALGSGMVTVNAPTGGLAINTGVTFTNPLTFTAGALGGFGTFAPSNLSNVSFGGGRIVVPGLPGSALSVGTLTFQNDVTFANAGIYEWTLQDNTRPDGFSQVVVNGNFNITSTAGGFLLDLISVGTTGAPGFAVFDTSSPASWIILQTNGTLTGFNPGAFTIDPNSFEGGIFTANNFSLSLDGTGKELLLNFSPVPEPSTWMLLASGAGVLGLAAFRRRR